MSFTEYFFITVYIIAFILLILVIIWRITCFFRKSCTWKNCPYRQNYHPTTPIGWVEKGCKKFPFTQEEIDEEEKLLEQAEKLIEQLREENKRSEQ